MARGGALIETTVSPDEGSMVQLIRGSLIVHGLVSWSAEGRCGLKFSGSVDVSHWRASPINQEQQRVDQIVRLVKAGAVPLPIGEQGDRQADDASSSDNGLDADLRQIADLLDSLGDVLAADAELLMKHGTQLQKLDIATQFIAALRSIYATGGELRSEPQLAGLRRSANQALRAQG